MRHEYDVFVCTTIVENGLDIPLANTIIIENAERYGLSELYQLRGRVGRSNRRAYAYLLVPPDTELTEIARKRLAALKEFCDLGAGFKIAALDLELRGAGNLLGGEQHGHIDAVGFDMYVRHAGRNRARAEGRGGAARDSLRAEPGARYSHSDRVHRRRESAPARLPAHRRARAMPQSASSIEKELEDRYGPVPEAVRNLLEYSALKTRRREAGHRAHRPPRRARCKSSSTEQTRVDPAKLMNLVSRTRGAQFTPAGVLRLPLDGVAAPGAVLAFVKERLGELRV